jgi:hypothetical protein
MEINYELKPTLVRTNSRHRGPTESEKYSNFIGETVHDLKLLGMTLDRNDFFFASARGQSDFIQDNMALYFSGENREISSNIGTSGKIIKVLGPVFDQIDLTTWTPLVSTVSKINNDTFQIVMSGSASAENRGVSKTLNVLEGQIIKMTGYFKDISGNPNSSGLGSLDANQGEGSYTIIDPVAGDYSIVEHYIYCTQKETLTLHILGKKLADSSGLGTVEVKDISIDYVEMNTYNLEATNTSIKSKINVLEDEINNILNNL